MRKLTMKKGLKGVFIVLLCGLILLNLFTVACTALNLRGQLRWLPCAFMEISSGSMEPEISAGDLAFVWETPYSRLKPGDVISYQSGTGYITHKIVRAEGNKFVTRGTANRLEDEPIGSDVYYGRVLFVIPAAAGFFGYISDPVKAVFEILIIISLFYGFSAIQYIDGLLETLKTRSLVVREAEGAKPPRRTFRPVKLFSCIFCASLLATSPCMTAARYVAVSNEFFTVAANASYFTSNLLSVAGDRYSIKGWNGDDYNLVLENRNYTNTLLYNREGINTTYALYLEPVTEGEYKSADYYSLSIAPSANADPASNPEEFPYPVDEDMHLALDDVSLFTSSEYYGDDPPELADGCYVSVPFAINGRNESGQIQDFVIQVRPSEDQDKKLSAGDKIAFNVYAFTCPSRGFYQVLQGEFTMEVAFSGTFLSPPVMNLSVGSLLINYRIMTNLISSADSASRTVLISWDASKVYLNEYEPTAFNQIYNTPGNNFIVQDTDGRGKLYMTLEAYSSVELQFFRMTADTAISDNSISTAVVEDNVVVEGSLAVVEEGE